MDREDRRRRDILARQSAAAPEAPETPETTDPEAVLDAAIAHHKEGQWREAERLYREVLEAQPDNANALHLLGMLAHQLGKPELAVELIGKAIEHGPDQAVFFNSQGNALLEHDRLDEAVASYRRALEIEPAYAEAHYNLGKALFDQGELEEAIACFHRALAISPNFAEAHYNLGNALTDQGKFEEAMESLECALAIRPDFAEAVGKMALIKKVGEGDRDIDRIQGLLAGDSLSVEQRIVLNFALAKIYDHLARYDEAFAHCRRANELKRAELGFDAPAHEDYLARLRDTFDAGFLADRKGWGVASELPVFIVGMPRSGTTLVEQILSTHPDVYGAGELQEIHKMVDALPGRLQTETPYPECVGLLDAATARDLARNYLDDLRSFSGSAERITDKTPHNFLTLGLVALLLPGARVFHCRRNPLDTCLSCYFQQFVAPHAYSQDLTNVGLYYRQYERLMEHWRRVLPNRLFEVHYEELVADQEGVSRGMIDFLGLEWDARCLAFHENERPVRTSSQWQVRQPLFTSSLERWRHYEKHLGPLKAALGYTRDQHSGNEALGRWQSPGA